MTVGENSFFLKVTLSFASKLGRGANIEEKIEDVYKIVTSIYYAAYFISFSSLGKLTQAYR